VAYTPHVYAVHGNTFYMHCKDEEEECSKTFYKCPKGEEVKDKTNHVPKCKECGKDMKPHSMFFDENYSEHYYRKESIEEFYKECDAMIVVGTALETTFALKMVTETLAREVPVIEVNMEPCIEVGHTYQVAGKAEESLPAIFNTYYSDLGVKAVKNKSKEESKQG
jgi:NAD-dependent SIR2 family protein deacetylase